MRTSSQVFLYHHRLDQIYFLDVTFPLDPQGGAFCTCDDSGKVGYHKLERVETLIKKLDFTAVATSKTDNEAVIAVPMNGLHLDEKYLESPNNFATQIKSQVNFISTGNENSDSKKFKYFAQK